MLKKLIVAVLFVSFAVAANAERLRVHSPNDGFLNLRTGPGTGFEVVIQMRHGSYVETLERSGNWVRVYHTSGSKGWASIKHLRKPVAASNKRTINSPGDGFLNLRTGPGSEFAVVRQMTHGSTVRILERKGNWVRVRHSSGARGWAFSKYLR